MYLNVKRDKARKQKKGTTRDFRQNIRSDLSDWSWDCGSSRDYGKFWNQLSCQVVRTLG